MQNLVRAVVPLFFLLQVIQVSAQEQLTAMSQNSSMGSAPSNFLVFNNRMLFVATTPSQGTELWVTDGTKDGTKLLKDIKLGAAPSGIGYFVLYKDKVYFTADDGEHGYQLWVTDGTANGTTMVSTSVVKYVHTIIANDDFIYFLKKDSQYKLELWKSDGTDQGTVVVKGDIDVWNDPYNLTSLGGIIFFTCQPFQSNKTKVWRSDGTNAGTYPVSVELDGNGSNVDGTSHPSQFISFNGSMYFIARGGSFASSESGLMKTDGTFAGTVAIKSMHSGSLIDYGQAFVHNNKMYFTLFEADNTRFVIWESDGSAANTKVIFDNTYAHYFSPSSILADGNYFYFTVGNASSGTSLAKFDITTKALQEVKELAGPIDPPFIFAKEFAIDFLVKSVTGTMYVCSRTGDFGLGELWISDGTNSGTQKVTAVSRIWIIASYGNLDYLSATGGQFELELWTSAGTASTVTPFKELSPGKLGMPYSQIAGKKDKVIFLGQDDQHGVEPWVTDGTTAGTKLLKDIVAGSSPSYFPNFANAENGFLFSGNVGINHYLFQTDGTEAGTTVQTTFPQSSYYRVSKTIDGKTFYYALTKSDETMSLYKHTIGAGTPVEIKNFGRNPYNVPLRITEMALTNSTVYLLLEAEGGDLWKSDGTQQGTVKVADFYEAHDLISVNNNVFFTVIDGFTDPDIELYKSDGTAGGTMMVKDLNGDKSAEPLELTAFGNKLLFTANDATAGREAWITDGTANGTKMLKDINIGPVGGVPHAGFAVNGGNVYFAASDGTHGIELWKSDGTSENTSMLKDLVPGAQSSSPNELVFHDDILYFSAYTPANGFEVWSSDGTAANTSMLVDVLPGPEYSNPSKFVKLDDYLVFYALTPLTGVQLWSYKFPETVTGLEELPKFSIYPNPSNGLIRMKHLGTSNAAVEIFSLDGRRIGNMHNVGEDSIIDITQQPPGMYVIKIVDGESCTTTKVNKY